MNAFTGAVAAAATRQRHAFRYHWPALESGDFGRIKRKMAQRCGPAALFSLAADDSRPANAIGAAHFAVARTRFRVLCDTLIQRISLRRGVVAHFDTFGDDVDLGLTTTAGRRDMSNAPVFAMYSIDK